MPRHTKTPAKKQTSPQKSPQKPAELTDSAELWFAACARAGRSRHALGSKTPAWVGLDARREVVAGPTQERSSQAAKRGEPTCSYCAGPASWLLYSVRVFTATAADLTQVRAGKDNSDISTRSSPTLFGTTRCLFGQSVTYPGRGPPAVLRARVRSSGGTGARNKKYRADFYSPLP